MGQPRARSKSGLAFAPFAAVVVLAGACAPASSGSNPDGAQASDAALSCNGLYGTTPSPDGTYYITTFGCWTDASGGIHTDPGDNCQPGCLSSAKHSLCAGMSGPECEEAVSWYSADSGRYGCMTRLRVTNPSNGKSVVVVVLDAGPNCSVEHSAHKPVLDMSGRANRYLFGADQGWADDALVQVEVVDPTTPLGPADGSSASSGGGSAPACTANGVDGTCIDVSECAAMAGYVATSGHCPGPASEQCCTPSAGGSSSATTGGAGGAPSSSTSTSTSTTNATTDVATSAAVTAGASSGAGTPCAGDGDCNPGNDGSGMICVDGYCTPGCHTDAQCPGITTCVSGQCQ